MTIEVSAKKVDDAIKQGLEQLGVTLDEVKVEVVESGGLFRKAKVRLTLETEAEKPAPAEAEPQKSESKVIPEKSEKTEKSEKPEQPEKVEKPEKSEKTEKTEKAEKAEKPETPAVEKAKKAEETPSVKPSTEKQGKASESGSKKDAGKTRDGSAKTAKKPNGAKTAAEADRTVDKPRQDDPQALEGALEFVKQAVAKMGFEATVEMEGDAINITAPSGDDSLIIGRHGETLSAIQYLAETAARAEKKHINVTVDCNGYRERRAASLSAMARRRASECVAKHRKIKLEPMDRQDRRTVHSALNDDERVSTASEGKEPHRYVVIYPKNEKKNGVKKPVFDSDADVSESDE